VVNQVHFEPGDLIIRQGDVGDQFYVIVSGEVDVFKELPSGQKAHLAKLGKGEYFGESALLTGRRRNASVQASTRVDLMCMGRDEFNNLAGAWLKFSEGVQTLSTERGKALSSDSEQSRVFRTIMIGSALGNHLAGLVPPPAPPATPAFNSREAAPPPSPYIPPPPQSYIPLPPHLIRSDGAELPLEVDVLNMGRAPDNHIVVNDREVSRRHAVLKREGTHYVLEDLGTANGTFVNNQRIQRYTLVSGDVIRLGHAVFTYRVPVAEQR
jgi:hypothetical protein